MSKELTIRQQKFVAAYLVSMNATRAAIEAGYSPKSAPAQAHQLLKKPKVQSMLAIKSGEVLNRYNVTLERVIEELAKIAFLDPRNLFKDDGTIKNMVDIDGDTAAAITSFRVFDRVIRSKGNQKQVIRVTKVKWANKLRTLVVLLRYLTLTEKAENPRLTLEQLICGEDEQD